MNPCKFCIVRACCKTECQQCEAYKIFIKHASTTITFIGLILSAIIVGSPLIYLIDFYPDKEFGKEIIQWVWCISIIINITFSKLNALKGSLFLDVFFGPFCTSIYLFMFLSAKIIKRV
jgi:hypothetical protein